MGMEVTLSLFPNIQKPTHCDIGAHWSHDKTKLDFPIFCQKCQAVTKRKTKLFKTINSLYKHVIAIHSNLDENIPPTKKQTLEDLRQLAKSLRGQDNE